MTWAVKSSDMSALLAWPRNSLLPTPELSVPCQTLWIWFGPNALLYRLKQVAPHDEVAFGLSECFTVLALAALVAARPSVVVTAAVAASA